jgi:ADP-heptose:LPS heptosyltransferase
MSNILIIKHGSLGDLIQANGAIKDIKEHFSESKVILLTSKAYSMFMSECPYIDGVLIDKRLPRWNLFSLYNLKKLLNRYNFTHIFDLQNSSRTKFYKNYLLKTSIWSSTETILELNQKKSDLDEGPVLDRMQLQLQKSGITTNHTKNIDLSWAYEDLSRLLKQYTNGDYILIFPFCSKKHKNKKWPFFNDLITKIKQEYKNKYPILLAPGPNEINDAYNLNAKVVLDQGKSINIKKLISLIKNAKFVVTNDTGPAHISSHLNKNGLALFGSHTSALKVSLGNSNFKIISVEKLIDLSVNRVFEETKKNLN